MSTKTITFSDYPASRSVYFRVFDSAGSVLDFDDETFKALSGATTPYIAATERSDMGGSGRSGYQADLNLAIVNSLPQRKEFVVQAYENATPADADNPIGDPLELPVIYSGVDRGEELIAWVEVSVKSTQGSAAQISAWLELGGRKIDFDAVGGTAFTADAGTDTITSSGHGLSDDDVVLLTNSGGALPAGLSATQPYFVISAATNTFQLSLTSGGAAVDITDAGTGTHKWHESLVAVTLKEHGGNLALFPAETIRFDELNDDVFEAEVTAPNFTDDRQYRIETAFTVEGVSIATNHNRVVIG